MPGIKTLKQFCQSEAQEDIKSYLIHSMNTHSKEIGKIVSVEGVKTDNIMREYHEQMYRAYSTLLYQINHFKF